MVNKIKILVVAYFLLANSLAGVSQRYPKELKDIRESYLKAKQLSFDVTAYSFDNKTDKTPKLISNGHVEKSGKNYYSSFLNYLLVVNDKNQILIIDKSRKAIDFFENIKDVEKTNRQFDINIDSIAGSSDSIIVNPVKDGLRQILIISNSDLIVRTEIFVDSKTNFIRRILYYYNKDANEDFESEFERVDVYYKNISERIDPDKFSIKKYINKQPKGNVYTGNGEFWGYKINYYKV